MNLTHKTPPGLVRTITTLRETVANWRAAGARIALIPTMGALHDGHLSLVTLGNENADRVIVSIFVNPTQFGPTEDFNQYPRDEADDITKLTSIGTDLIFAPSAEEMYGDRFATTVHVGDVSEGLCGAVRPGHFDGVATIVSKLLLQAAPDVAIFGEKDYQQLMVIRRLVDDLNIPTHIVGAPIVREPDGLAMSSRNRYLSPQHRRIAAQLNQTLRRLSTELASGTDSSAALENARLHLIDAGFDGVDYLEARDADTLAPWTNANQTGRIFAAVHLGSTRLIDNMPIEVSR